MRIAEKVIKRKGDIEKIKNGKISRNLLGETEKWQEK